MDLRQIIETRRQQLRWSRYRLLSKANIPTTQHRTAYYFLSGKSDGNATLIGQLLDAMHLNIAPRAITTEVWVDKRLYDIDWEKEATALPQPKKT
jgi:hypothetical protein